MGLTTLQIVARGLWVFFAVAAMTAHAKDEVRYYTHVAVKGDTLSKIAHRYQIKKADWKSLQKLNDIADPDRIPIGKLVRIPVPAMRTEVAPVKVLSVQGKVDSSRGGLEAGASVREGDKIQTAEGSFVTLQLADGSTLTVQSKSSVTVESARQFANTGGVPDSVMRLDAGRVETRVAKQKSTASRYEIRTPTSNMAVRGTVFRVGADESGKRAQSEVLEGRVGVSAADVKWSARELPVDGGFGTIAEAGKAPMPPIALLPAPVLRDLPSRTGTLGVAFTVGAVEGATSYRAQVARDPAFTDVVRATRAEGPTLLFEELPPGSLYLRVRAVDVNGLEGKDATHAFLSVLLPAPKLPPEDRVVPAIGAIVPASALRFAWDVVESAKSYRLQVATDPAFQHVVLDKLAVDKAELEAAQSLGSGQYYWRVAAQGAFGEQSDFSPVREFILRADRLRLAQPIVSGSNIKMSWNGDPGVTYEWQLAKDERFRDVIEERRVSATSVSVEGIARGFYFARVRPVVKGLALPWSDAMPVEVYRFAGGK